ncbi:MAG: glycosyltransferase [Planctomycetota bacterium]
MRILVASPFLPHPAAEHGGAVYLGTVVEALARRAEVTLACLAPPEPEPIPPAPRGLTRLVAIRHAHLHDLRGAQRAQHKAKMLREWARPARPAMAAKFWSPELANRLAALVNEIQPDVALVEFAVMAQYLPALAPTATVLTDHECGAPLPIAIGPAGLGRRRDARQWTHYLERHYADAALVQTLTEEDAALLASRLGRPVEVRPAVIPLPDRVAAPDRAPPRALFLGNFRHDPNTDAAVRIATQIWPAVHARLPDARLHIVGHHPPAAVRALATRPGVAVLGAVPDLTTALGDVRLLLAPLYAGAGVRIKTLTALAHGLPVVCNALGARGIDAPAPALTRAETAAALGEATCALLADPARAATAGAAARQWAEQTRSPDAMAAQQLDRFAALLRTHDT